MSSETLSEDSSSETESETPSETPSEHSSGGSSVRLSKVRLLSESSRVEETRASPIRVTIRVASRYPSRYPSRESLSEGLAYPSRRGFASPKPGEDGCLGQNDLEGRVDLERDSDKHGERLG